MQQLQQADWVRQQEREKQLYADQAKFDRQANDDQTQQLHTLLTKAQDDHHAKRKAMLVAMQEQNAQSAKEKRDKDNTDRLNQMMQEQHELHATLTSDFMTENPLTEKSMLADHRVKPYHMKGFSEEQTRNVMHERDLQLKEQELLKKTEQEKERLWAMQQEHLRRQALLKDRELKFGNRTSANVTRAT